MRRLALPAGLLLALTLLASAAQACEALTAGRTDGVIQARFVPVQAGMISITFVGHASFLIRSPQGVTALTDYNGYDAPAEPPDIATMNNAHSTHYTDRPDPRIPHVLRGWRDDGGPARVDLTVGDVRVTNLPTTTKSWMTGATETYGNSIFVFQMAGLCIAHLSHLHHVLTDSDVAALGRIDVVIPSVDGSWTMGHAEVARVLEQLKAPLVIPAHYVSRSVLERFLGGVRARFDIQYADSDTIQVSRNTLPRKPGIVVLQGY